MIATLRRARERNDRRASDTDRRVAYCGPRYVELENYEVALPCGLTPLREGGNPGI